MKTLASALLLAVLAAAYAGEVLETDVTHEDGRYTVRFDIRLDAPADRLRQHLLDYEKYATHFQSIKESKVLDRTPEGGMRVRLRLHSCVLFFCRTVTQVKNITEQPDGTIEARIDPELSDFREATEHWRIVPENDKTRLQYRAELEPTFFVPPLIGPWLLKNQIRNALESGALKLEAVANEQQ